MTSAKHDLKKGGIEYVAYLSQTELEECIIDNIKIVKEYPDVFSDELPGLPPDQQIEFAIDIIPEAFPIAWAPYQLAPSDMEELRK